MKISWNIGAIISLIAAFSLFTTEISYAAGSSSSYTLAYKSLCTFVNISTDDEGPDPIWQSDAVEYYKDYAQTEISLSDGGDTITLSLINAYEGYCPTLSFGVSNQWQTPGIVESIDIQNDPALTVSFSGLSEGQIIEAGQIVSAALMVGVGTSGQYIEQNTQYSVTVNILTAQYTGGGVMNITTSSLPDSTVGEDYSQTLSVEKGNPDYTWAIISGELPEGLSLDALTGTISGIPTNDAAYSFTVQATDCTGDTDEKDLSITVIEPLAIATASLESGRVSRDYSDSLEAKGGTGPYTWSIVSGLLPDGISLKKSAGGIGSFN